MLQCYGIGLLFHLLGNRFYQQLLAELKSFTGQLKARIANHRLGTVQILLETDSGWRAETDITPVTVSGIRVVDNKVIVGKAAEKLSNTVEVFKG